MTSVNLQSCNVQLIGNKLSSACSHYFCTATCPSSSNTSHYEITIKKNTIKFTGQPSPPIISRLFKRQIAQKCSEGNISALKSNSQKLLTVPLYIKMCFGAHFYKKTLYI